MMSQLKKLQEALYGRDGLGVTNFKVFPGSNRDVTAEQMAEQINSAIAALYTGDDVEPAVPEHVAG